jgi:hypothetical protein
MPKTSILLALFLLSLARPAAADNFYVSMNTLYGWCKPYEVGDESLGSLCEGYLNAIADILADGLPIHDSRACIPEGVRLIDLRNVVIEGLDAAPDSRGVDAHSWAARAISRAYPCGNAGN